MYYSLLLVVRNDELNIKYEGFDTYRKLGFDIEIRNVIDDKMVPYLENEAFDNPNTKTDWFTLGVRKSVVYFGDAFILKNGFTTNYAFVKDIDWVKTKKNFGGWFFTYSVLIDDKWIDIEYPDMPNVAIAVTDDGLKFVPVDKESYDKWLDECSNIFRRDILSRVKKDDVVCYISYHL